MNKYNYMKKTLKIQNKNIINWKMKLKLRFTKRNQILWKNKAMK